MLYEVITEGSGWTVIDLGVDVPSTKFIEAIKANPGAVVGMSALLTTTMTSMQDIVADVRKEFPDIKIIIGGAPITHDFCKQIHADFYSPDPQGAVKYLKELAA